MYCCRTTRTGNWINREAQTERDYSSTVRKLEKRIDTRTLFKHHKNSWKSSFHCRPAFQRKQDEKRFARIKYGKCKSWHFPSLPLFSVFYLLLTLVSSHTSFFLKLHFISPVSPRCFANVFLSWQLVSVAPVWVIAMCGPGNHLTSITDWVNVKILPHHEATVLDGT